MTNGEIHARISAMANIDPDPAPSYDAAEQADQPEPKLCRKCRGWGVISTPYGGGVFGTEDCRQCAGTGAED